MDRRQTNVDVDIDSEEDDVVLVGETNGKQQVFIVPSASSSDEDEDSSDSTDEDDPAPAMVLNPASVRRAATMANMPPVIVAPPVSRELTETMEIPVQTAKIGNPSFQCQTENVVPMEVPIVGSAIPVILASHVISVTPAPNLDVPEILTTKVIENIDMDTEVPAPMTANNSLRLLASYGSDTDESEDETVTEKPATPAIPKEVALKQLEELIDEGNYRIISDSSEESDGDDSSSDSEVEIVTKLPKETVKARGEMGIDDLPPIEDLKITVAEEECVELGKIFSIVEQLGKFEIERNIRTQLAYFLFQLVLVDSLPGTVPLDLDTVLFLDKGKRPLGQVFDVLGNISSPLYCVRFNSNQEILDKQLTVGTIVYVAPRTEHTTFVILGNLMKQKGCDASWEHDVETPSKCMEYSDDEEERLARRVRRGKQPAGGSDATGTSEAVDDVNKRPRQTDDNASHNNNGVLPNPHIRRGGGRNRGRGDSRRFGRGGMQHQQQYPHYQNGNQQSHQQTGNFDRSRMYPNENYSWHTNLPFGGNYQQPPPPLPLQHYQQPGTVSHLSYRAGYPSEPPTPHHQQPYSHTSYPQPYFHHPHYPPQPPA